MFKLYFMYPMAAAHFDMARFRQHMHWAQELLGSACLAISIEEGNAKIFPCAYKAIGVFVFENKDSAYDAFSPVLTQICDDVPHFTDGDPVISATTA